MLIALDIDPHSMSSFTVGDFLKRVGVLCRSVAPHKFMVHGAGLFMVRSRVALVVSLLLNLVNVGNSGPRLVSQSLKPFGLSK